MIFAIQPACALPIRPSVPPVNRSPSNLMAVPSRRWRARPSPPRSPPPASRRSPYRLRRAARRVLRRRCVLGLRRHGERRIGQRACKTLAADGMTVSSTAPDIFQSRRTGPAAEERTCDILVVGGGAAGLSAAAAAARRGLGRGAGRRPGAGRPYARPLAPSHTTIEPDKQFRLGIELRAQAIQAGVRWSRTRWYGPPSPPMRSRRWCAGIRRLPPPPADPGDRRV